MSVPAKCTLQLTYFDFAESNALQYERQSTKVGTADKTFTFQYILTTMSCSPTLRGMNGPSAMQKSLLQKLQCTYSLR